MSADIGSKEWITEQSNKLLDFGLGVLSTKLLGKDTYPSNSSSGDLSRSVESGYVKWLPYAIGGVFAVGIFFILKGR